MHRDIEKELISWKSQKERYPLIIRGARQVGKSYLVETFGKTHFQNIAVVNFEFQPQLKDCFQSLDPFEIINKLQLLLGVQIKEDNTLLFLDEIQECPRAIMSLRYFKEKMPKMAVIAAGSLLEFALRSPDFKMPVGRIHFLYLEPLSFSEYLDAVGSQKLRNFLSEVELTASIDDVIHKKLLELLRSYLIVGGMPAVLKEYLPGKDLMNCQRIQTGLLQTYRSDFGKYAKISQHINLQKLFDTAPRLVGQRIKYSNIDPNTRSRDLKNALNLLTLAGIIKPIYLTKASGLPLGAQINEQKFKLNFLDTGLMQNSCGLQGQLSVEKNLMQINAGSVAEQFVGQELTAYSDKHQQSSLYFWAREKKNSMAEVDYVINIGSNIFPVEVKSGKEGRLKSLRMFLEEKKSKLGIRFSQDKLSYHDKILSIPLYMIEQLPRFIKSILRT
ncbi:MAG: ATP-binding protein [Nitrospirae bacterium]|nr:ATP-binding protein [Nitrospirota bacterium]